MWTCNVETITPVASDMTMSNVTFVSVNKYPLKCVYNCCLELMYAISERYVIAYIQTVWLISFQTFQLSGPLRPLPKTRHVTDLAK